MNHNIFITREIPEAALELVRRELGKFDINPHDRVLSRKELLKQVKGRDGVLCLLTDRIDREVMEAAGKQIKVFSNMAVGVDNIDMKEAARRKILVTSTPGVLTTATAEMAWALLFAASRRIVESDRFVRAGKFKGWSPLLHLGEEISGKTLGIIGAGRIGAAFGQMSKGFNLNLLYYSRSINAILEGELHARKVDLETLLKESDFISIHVSLNQETRHLIGEKELAMMKPSAVLVNTARGAVIDEKALVKALKTGKIFAAGLDVYENEPNLALGLAKLPNVVIPAHIGSATIETRTRMATLAAQNLIAVLKGEKIPHLVNPEAQNGL